MKYFMSLICMLGMFLCLMEENRQAFLEFLCTFMIITAIISK